MAKALLEAGLIESATGSIKVTTSMKRTQLQEVLERVLRVEEKVRVEAVAVEGVGEDWDADTGGDAPAPIRRSQRGGRRRPARFETGDSPARQRRRSNE